jgi:SAM-dependent methyltransferase
VDGHVGHFGGTARFYANYRPSYPEEVWDLLGREASLTGSSSVLDLGCGPGTAALSLADRVGSVTAVDPDLEMLVEGQRTAALAGIDNVRWVHETAEDFEGEPGDYRLVVIASAFHWMDRRTVAANCHAALEPAGVLAVLGNPTLLMQIRKREAGIGAAMADVQDRWFGNDHFPLDIDRLARPEDVLRASPFGTATVLQVPCEQQWDVERFLGFLRSTSSRPDQRLGDRFPDFADDVRTAVESVEPSGQWSLRSAVEVILSRR